MSNKSGESGHACLAPDLRGNPLSFSPLSMLAVGLSYTAFIILRRVPSLPTLLEFLFLNHKWILKGIKYK